MPEDQKVKRLLYKGVYINVTKHDIHGETVFRIVFEDSRKPLVITESTSGSRSFWTSLPQGRPNEVESGNDIFISGGRVRILSITVNQDNRENIEFVPKKAKAGYLTGFNDPEFIEKLPKFTLPYLPENRTYRMFPTEGDSMLPIPENCYVITEYVEDWNDMKSTPCIVILRMEQHFVFKVVTLNTDKQTLLLHSLNPAYKDKEVFAGDILEIWKYHSHITDAIPSSENILEEVLRTVIEIKSVLKDN